MTSSYYAAGTDLTFVMLSAADETRLFSESSEGNEESRDFLIQNHLLFAAMHARRLAKGRLPEREVISAANLALMKAFKLFNHSHGSRFTSYLKPFIQGEISKLWKTHFKDSQTDAITKDVACPSDNPHESIQDDEYAEFLRDMLAECKDVLNPHEKEIIKLHYLEGINFADIARTRGVSREAVRASNERALEKLKKAFKKRGVTQSK